jgi:antitoxin CptB
MTENNSQIKKILYRAVHRGCKETDFLLGDFFVNNQHEINNFGEQLCDNFLNEDDMEIYDWILDKSAIPTKYQIIIKKIRDFHNI